MFPKKLSFSVKILVLASFVASALGLSTVYTLDASAGNRARKLIFAVDGLSYDAFMAARSRGLFKGLDQAGRHMAPYPSMSEVSWTELMGGRKLFPLQGNVKTAEAKTFDIDTLTTVDDPRLLFNRYANPYNFTRAFDYMFNPVMEGLMYFPNQSIINMEFEELEKEIYAGFTGDHFIAYVSSVDAIAHTQKDSLYPVLEKLSHLIDRVSDHYGRGVEIALVSDHGNIGAFAEGEKEIYLRPVSPEALVGDSGLKIVSTKLKSSREIAMPILALGNYANVFFKDLGQRRRFADAALKNPAVELITYVDNGSGAAGSKTVILGKDSSEAELTLHGSLYLYRTVSGNPLGLDSSVMNRESSDSEMLRASLQTNYPDSPFRLAQVMRKQVATEGDLILNLKDGHCFEGAFSKYVRMVRTHGSLSAKSTYGVVASSERKIPSHIRSSQFLSLFGMSAANAFHKQDDFFPPSAKDPLANLNQIKAQAKKGVATRIDDLSPDMIFLRLNKIIAGTLDVLTMDDFSDLMAGASSGAEGTHGVKLSKSRRASLEAQAKTAGDTVGKLDVKTIMGNMDRLVALKDMKADPKNPGAAASGLKHEVLNMPGFGGIKALEGQISSESRGAESGQLQIARAADGIRRMVMKLYSMPYLINQTLNLPEMPNVPETRDLKFAETWLTSLKAKTNETPGQLLQEPAIARKLFRSVFDERILFHDISPASLPLIYNSVPKDLTVVFVPGVYNELFDKEIFAKGLRSLRDELGLRVIYADVDGRCSSEINSQQILDLMKKDASNRMQRGYSKPKYLILGYSKGGVDSTQALLLDESFTRSSIAGLVSIASPHSGTSIIETADLPASILDQVVVKPIPQECRSQTSSSSMLRATRENFWAKNLSKLSGITRFFSLTFEADAKSAHPWMKITKAIGRFRAPNDGVVTTASSKFPPELNAIDLGTIKADHLAGIVASDFPQDAFLESILLTLFEMKAFDAKVAHRWFEAVASRSTALQADYRERQMERFVLKSLLASGAKSLVNAVGPFPDANAPESDDWYGIIAREKAFLNSRLSCKAGDEHELARATDALEAALKSTDYATRDIKLSCQDGKVMLYVQTGEREFYKVWEDQPSECKAVGTLKELIDLLLGKGMKSGKDLLDVQSNKIDTIPKSARVPFVLPQSSLKWSPETLIDLRKFPQTMEANKVGPLTPQDHKDGLKIVFDHAHAVDFRREYGFSYESTSPGAVDDNLQNGYAPKLDADLNKAGGNAASALRMKTKNSSIRMTTPYLRFKPADFSKMALKVKVVQGVPGGDSAKGSTGKDDSAFQIWFTLRNIKVLKDRAQYVPGGEAKILGYYWGEKSPSGQPLAPRAMIENYYSKKNFVVAVLPEAWQFVIGATGSTAAGAPKLNQWFDFKTDLKADMKKAFPSDNPADWEVVAITIQTDSNDTKSQSEAYLKEVSFTP
ncbi:MAG: DUF3047 domain-containing protein [Methylotenera sp.]|nr:DUF3047 domain-containing protein [Oligoflexia bacterium]